MASAPISPDIVRSIVAEVLARIQSGQVASAAGSPAARAPTQVAGQVTSSQAAAAQSSGNDGPVITDRVITLALLERLSPGTRRLTVPAAAVITPSAREFAVDAGIEILRATVANGSAAARPLVIARADCPSDLAGRAAGIPRAVPGTQQLPAAGLGAAIDAFATHVPRDGARCLLLTIRPAAAVILANRQPSLRAITGRDTTTVMAAIDACAANVVAIDPRDFSAVSLERLAVEFAKRNTGSVPAELDSAPTPCGCQGHSH